MRSHHGHICTRRVKRPSYGDQITMYLRAIPLVSALCLGACAVSTGILPAGPNTYQVTERMVPVRGGIAGAQAKAMAESDAFCRSQGREFLPTDTNADPHNLPLEGLGYSVTFECLRADDPRLAQGGSTRAPDQVVDQRLR